MNMARIQDFGLSRCAETTREERDGNWKDLIFFEIGKGRIADMVGIAEIGGW